MEKWNLDERIRSDPYLQGYFDGAIELLHLEYEGGDIGGNLRT